MLPNYIKIREKISSFYKMYLSELRKNQLGPLNEIEGSCVFEGRTVELKRCDGEIDLTEIKTFKTPFNFEYADVEKLSFDDIMKKIQVASKDMTSQYVGHLIEILEETTAKTGNIVGYKDNVITPENILELLDKMYMDFDKNLQPTKKVILVNKIAEEQIKRALDQIEKDPVLKTKLEEITERKRREHIERENNRELVG